MQGRVVLGKYRVDRFVGKGSMGQVFLAKPIEGGPDVVVKFMHADVAAQPRFRELFAAEMQMMARFHHPHAVRLLEGTLADPAGPCIVMEYVPGIEMEALLQKRGPMLAGRLTRIVVPLCQALNAAHSAGIIHRDLKPSNVRVLNADTFRETVKVMDLGLASLAYKPYIPVAKLQGSDDGYLVGSPAYMCPEQIRGDDTDARGDLYSLGVLLFEALTGRMPFEDEDVPKLLGAHVEREVPTFAQLGLRDIPPKVEALVQHLLAKYPNERPQTAFEVAERYLQAVGSETALSPSDFEPQDVIEETPSANTPPEASNVNRIVQGFDAWMPEAVAVVKLRGFLEDQGAKLLESLPGIIRVQFGELAVVDDKPRGLFGWLRRPAAAVVVDPAPEPMLVDLYLTRRPGAATKLEIKAVFQALDGPLPADPRWHKRTKKVFNDLKAYLIASN